MPKTILLTGGAGYIGSHTALEMIRAGYEVVVADNLSNGSRESLNRVERLTGVRIRFYQADVRDARALEDIFIECDIGGVVHFAGLKAVGESVEKPLLYYRHNLDATLSLLEVMARRGVGTLIFSSSATVYDPACAPVYTEDAPLKPVNPYGWTKFMCERIIKDACAAEKGLSALLLRYFNPVGAHESGLIGEDPRGVPNNLMPYISQVAVGRREYLTVHGGDYPTPDGTGIRDYIHVSDLARGHVAALDFLLANPCVDEINLGTGRGCSVLEVVKAFERASGRPIPYRIGPRRSGDIAAFWADATKARKKLGWEARHDLSEMCADAWRWQSMNPGGYEL